MGEVPGWLCLSNLLAREAGGHGEAVVLQGTERVFGLVSGAAEGGTEGHLGRRGMAVEGEGEPGFESARVFAGGGFGTVLEEASQVLLRLFAVVPEGQTVAVEALVEFSGGFTAALEPGAGEAERKGVAAQALGKCHPRRAPSVVRREVGAGGVVVQDVGGSVCVEWLKLEGLSLAGLGCIARGEDDFGLASQLHEVAQGTGFFAAFQIEEDAGAVQELAEPGGAGGLGQFRFAGLREEAGEDSGVVGQGIVVVAEDAAGEQAGIVGSRGEATEDFGGERGLAHATWSLKRGVMVSVEMFHDLRNQLCPSEETLGWLGREPRRKVEVAGQLTGEDRVRGEE